MHSCTLKHTAHSCARRHRVVSGPACLPWGRNSCLTCTRVQNRPAKQANFYEEFSEAP